MTQESFDLLYASEGRNVGFCNADPEKVASGKQNMPERCYCFLDGRDGPLCHDHVRAYCPGGCNNHGTCFKGYCEVMSQPITYTY